MTALFSYLWGLLFGIGLLVSEMSNPAKVLAFLDITGLWDPSLAFVMIGAIAVGFIAFRIAKLRSQAVCGTVIDLPNTTRIDRKLIVGSLLFGVGWGLAGFCPGPAIVAVGTGNLKAILFTCSMLVGMFIYEMLFKTQKS